MKRGWSRQSLSVRFVRVRFRAENKGRAHLCGDGSQGKGSRHACSIHDTASSNHRNAAFAHKKAGQGECSQSIVVTRRIENATMAACLDPLRYNRIHPCGFGGAGFLQAGDCYQQNSTCRLQGRNLLRRRKPEMETDDRWLHMHKHVEHVRIIIEASVYGMQAAWRDCIELGKQRFQPCQPGPVTGLVDFRCLMREQIDVEGGRRLLAYLTDHFMRD
ncbi:hypothetical protein BFX83_13480 [Komagataeibacter xylinus]|nr:hypothetical protein BFX83_13480 [Komagataeibacter xylinus]